MTIFGLISAIIFGGMFGSLATLFAYRLPLNESCFGRYFGPKSRCPKCNTIIRTRELIPVINWLITLGKCQKCQARISLTHLFIEVSTVILFAICYFRFSFNEEFIIYSLISVCLVILLVTDYTHKVFPNQILSVIAAIGFANRAMIEQTIINSVFAAAIGVVFAAIFYQVFYKESHGIFANKNHSFDYTKFVLAASVILPLRDFLLYFVTIMSIFTLLLVFSIPTRKNHNNFGYCLILPFLWLMLYSPLA
jgi:prepilin signal peptidase PulO-like enzyme (type II secretory pathway)